MTGRVAWSTYGGDDIEAVVAIMLLRQHPHGRRIRPSQGDGGLDVVIPHSARKWEVYQVKSFATTLSASHKKQIKKSWERMLAYTAKQRVQVTKWHVVRPIDPTREDIAWLNDLTAGSGIPSAWTGLATLDGWAAQFQDVIDYYLMDGKQRVLDTARDFVRAAGLDRAAGTGQIISTETALEGLMALAKALNEIDPHYRYRLTADTAPADGTFQMPPDLQDLVYSSAIVRDGILAQVDVFQRYNEVQLDRPLPDELSVTFKPTSPTEHEAVTQFLTYGIPLHGVPAEVAVTGSPDSFELPDLSTGTLSILPGGDTQPRPFDLVVAVENDHERVEHRACLLMNPPTTGVNNQNRQAWTGEDPSGVLEVTILVSHQDRQASLSLSMRDISGVDPQTALETLAAVSAMRDGASVSLNIPGGPAVLSLGTLPDTLFAEPEVLEHRTAVCAALTLLQTKIPIKLSVPDMATTDTSQLFAWFNAAALLDGEEVRRAWTALPLTLRDADTDLRLPRLFRVTHELTVTIEDRDWNVGYIDQFAEAVAWTPTSDDGRKGVLTPGENTIVRVALATDPEAAERAVSGSVELALPDAQSENPD
ncbi:hypothetical protein [Amycolatopsis sp. cmx-4-54]|uniref:hypothetical protein n=1 Tax=Amycolatopsis sp. cmx-4-54 TaxID=2790936 RepID=UPI0039783763